MFWKYLNALWVYGIVVASIPTIHSWKITEITQGRKTTFFGIKSERGLGSGTAVSAMLCEVEFYGQALGLHWESSLLPEDAKHACAHDPRLAEAGGDSWHQDLVGGAVSLSCCSWKKQISFFEKVNSSKIWGNTYLKETNDLNHIFSFNHKNTLLQLKWNISLILFPRYNFTNKTYKKIEIKTYL